MKTKTLACGRTKTIHEDQPSEAQLLAWKEQLKNFLIEKKLKYTEQRWKIAKTILMTGGHLDSQGLVERVKEKYPEIGAATVYRTIKVLCDANIMKESLRDTEGRVVFEIYGHEHHDHIICLDCGEIFEFHSEEIEEEQNKISNAIHFKISNHRHVIYAHCEQKTNA